VSVEAFEERSGVVEIDSHLRVVGEHGEKRQIGAIASLFDDLIEVAEWLVAMGGEDQVQMKLLRGSAQSYRRDSSSGEAR
jgi:hypothetical protein